MGGAVSRDAARADIAESGNQSGRRESVEHGIERRQEA